MEGNRTTKNQNSRRGKWPNSANLSHMCHYHYTDHYNNITRLFSNVFSTLSKNHFKICKKRGYENGKKNWSSAIARNCRNCKLIARSLKCNSAHLCQRLHFAKIKRSFHKTYGDGTGLKARSSVLLKKEEKGYYLTITLKSVFLLAFLLEFPNFDFSHLSQLGLDVA